MNTYCHILTRALPGQSFQWEFELLGLFSDEHRRYAEWEYVAHSSVFELQKTKLTQIYRENAYYQYEYLVPHIDLWTPGQSFQWEFELLGLLSDEHRRYAEWEYVAHSSVFELRTIKPSQI